MSSSANLPVTSVAGNLDIPRVSLKILCILIRVVFTGAKFIEVIVLLHIRKRREFLVRRDSPGTVAASLSCSHFGARLCNQRALLVEQ